jgi:hypothetical protein
VFRHQWRYRDPRFAESEGLKRGSQRMENRPPKPIS